MSATESSIVEVTQAAVDSYAAGEGLTEMDAYDALTLGHTVLRDRMPASGLSAERVILQHRFGPERHITVRVEGPTTEGFDPQPNGSVNWTAWGAQDPETATVYAGMLLLAAEIAPTLAPQAKR